MNLNYYLNKAIVSRRINLILNRLMFTAIGFAFGTVLCLGKNQELIIQVAGTVIFIFLLIFVVAYYTVNTDY